MKKFKNYLFLGFGLIGGSIARALRADDKDVNITAWVRHRENIEPALKEGTINVIADSLISHLDNADVIFLCAPTGSNIENLKTIAPLANEGTLITDVGSVKGDIQAAADVLPTVSLLTSLKQMMHTMMKTVLTAWRSINLRKNIQKPSITI